MATWLETAAWGITAVTVGFGVACLLVAFYSTCDSDPKPTQRDRYFAR